MAHFPLPVKTIYLLVFILVFLSPKKVNAATISDTCFTNDNCSNATLITNVVTGSPAVCVDGCNFLAASHFYPGNCQTDSFPTVWFRLKTDATSTHLNISVTSDDFESPFVELYSMMSGCSSIEHVLLSSLNTYCATGANGQLTVVHNIVNANATYLIAVTAYDSQGGNFQLCISTIHDESQCVLSADIDVKSRSFGGDLGGPFLPGETVSVCMNIHSYTAAGNGCQWFQGIIPSFGIGWDPAFFDNTGQPLNPTVNGGPMGDPGNGLYGASTWDWFTDVGYHHTENVLQIGDTDGNGTMEICHSLYEDCPDLGGVTGGCCGPCWLDPGQLLPAGWFAYGINGSCGTPGPPIAVDWGDGNTCGDGMGPWNFCFDLHVKPFPDCLFNEYESDLKLGFIPMSDGETGSWTGGASVCLYDKPPVRYLQTLCGTEVQEEFITLDPLCSGDFFNFLISEPGVNHWYWSMESLAFTNEIKGDGPDQSIINQQIHNSTSMPRQVIVHFKGILDSMGFYLSKDVSFIVYPAINIEGPSSLEICYNRTEPIVIPFFPSGGTGAYSYLWLPSGNTTPDLVIHPPFQSETFTIILTDQNGCSASKDISLVVNQNCFTTDIDPDESNEKPTRDSLLDGGNFINDFIEIRSIIADVELSIKIYPVPAKDLIIIEWTNKMIDFEKLIITDLNGKLLNEIDITGTENALNSARINIQSLHSGVYLLSLLTKSGRHTSKLVKI